MNTLSEQASHFLLCVIREVALDARVKNHGIEMIDKHRKELDAFRDLVQSKIVEFWEDSKDIKIAITKKLGQLSRREDLVGWVRAHQEANLPALSNEIARLSKENGELRSQLGAKAEVTINGLSYSQMKALLQRKGLWGYVKDHLPQLTGGIDRRTDPAIDGLAQLGLMSPRQPGYEIFLPTDGGRMLLNRIEFDELPPK